MRSALADEPERFFAFVRDCALNVERELRLMSECGEPRELSALWDFNDPAGSEVRFRAIADGARDAGMRAEALTQVARAQGLQRRFEAAEATLREVEGMLRVGMPAGGMQAARVRWLLERGRVLNSSGRGDEARPLFVAAWEEAEGAAIEALAVDAAHMVAIVSSGNDVLAWNQRALEVAKGSPDSGARRWLGSLYNNIGWTHHDAGRFEEALSMFVLALEEREKQARPREVLIARWCIARALRSLGRVEEAFDKQRELLEAHRAAGSTDGFVHEELGECLLALGRAGAGEHFARAHELLSMDEWFRASSPERLARLARLADAGAEPGPRPSQD